MKKKICHIASFLDYSLCIEATGAFLDKDKYEISFVFLSPKEGHLQKVLAERGHRVEWIKYNSRKDLPRATMRLRKLFAEIKPDAVHTHMTDASLAGLFAARLSGIKNRLHTRHHASECHTFYPHAVYYDKLISYLSTHILATTKIVEETLVKLENVDPKKVSLITYGYDLSEFSSDEETRLSLREKYGLKDKFPVVGVISRFVEWKGVQYIIPAFAKLAGEYPNAKLALANAIGSYSSEIQALLERHLKPEQYVVIKFEPKVFDLYKNFDLFVHVPINRDFEAFGQTYIEALFMEIPSVFTLSGVAHDFIKDRENALVVPYKDSESIYRAMREILNDNELRDKIVRNGKAAVEGKFSGTDLAEALDGLYSKF